jgi:predicted DNA-binding transcriptional regulator AlpA
MQMSIEQAPEERVHEPQARYGRSADAPRIVAEKVQLLGVDKPAPREATPKPIGAVSLSAADRAWVAHTAALIRAAVLRQAGGEAEVIAEKVAAKLQKEPAPIAKPDAVYISVEEAATILGVSREALDKRIQRRQVPGVVRTAGRRVQIDRARMLTGLAKRGR